MKHPRDLNYVLLPCDLTKLKNCDYMRCRYPLLIIRAVRRNIFDRFSTPQSVIRPLLRNIGVMTCTLCGVGCTLGKNLYQLFVIQENTTLVDHSHFGGIDHPEVSLPSLNLAGTTNMYLVITYRSNWVRDPATWTWQAQLWSWSSGLVARRGCRTHTPLGTWAWGNQQIIKFKGYDNLDQFLRT